MERVLISEPSKMIVPRYYEYLPKIVHDTKIAVCEKFVRDNVTANPGLETQHITVKFILLRCNLALDMRGDI